MGVQGDLQTVLLGGAAGSFVTADSLDLPLRLEDTRAAGPPNLIWIAQNGGKDSAAARIDSTFS
jgi:hypothetical protein